jgi:hypothetical protein
MSQNVAKQIADYRVTYLFRDGEGNLQTSQTEMPQMTKAEAEDEAWWIARDWPCPIVKIEVRKIKRVALS